MAKGTVDRPAAAVADLHVHPGVRPWLRFVIGGALAGALVVVLVAWFVFRAPPAEVQTSFLSVVLSVASSGTVPDARTLEAFFDELIAAQTTGLNIPGATVAVVNNGALVFAKGYGWADVERRVPVVAERTLFHIGSTSKLSPGPR